MSYKIVEYKNTRWTGGNVEITFFSGSSAAQHPRPTEYICQERSFLKHLGHF